MATSPSDLTKEKSLFAVWLLAFKFKQSRFNLIMAGLIGAVLLRYVQLSEGQSEQIIALLRRLVTSGITLAPSTLGFLIAGFTVFVTVIRIDVFLEMAKREKTGSGESFLKYNLSPFMVVFVHFVAYLFTCIVLDLMIQPGGLASIAISNARTYPEINCAVNQARYLLSGSLLIIMGTWTIYLVMLLKSLAFNIYHVTITAVRWEWEKSSEAQDR
jgi:hypothetical protein